MKDVRGEILYPACQVYVCESGYIWVNLEGLPLGSIDLEGLPLGSIDLEGLPLGSIDRVVVNSLVGNVIWERMRLSLGVGRLL